MKKLVMAVLATTILAGCKTSPTGRTQIALYSDQQMSQMGQASFAEMKKTQPINSDPRVNNYVKCIANDVIAELPQEYANQSWEGVVFEEDSARNWIEVVAAAISVFASTTIDADPVVFVIWRSVPPPEL